jgi:hypothetical protein
MRGRVVWYFFAVIFCVGASRTLFPHLLADARELQTLNPTEISFENGDREYSSSHSIIISAGKGHRHPDFLQPFPVWEIEETDDENDTSDFYDHPRSLPEKQSELACPDLPLQSSEASPIPLFILLHSWRHFLS